MPSLRRFMKIGMLALVAAAFLGLSLGATGTTPLGLPSMPSAQAKVKPGDPAYDLSSIVILTRVLSYVRNNYYDPVRVDPPKMFKKALLEVSRSIPAIMIDFDEKAKTYTVALAGQTQTMSYGEIKTIWAIQYAISDFFRFIAPHLDKNIDPKDVEYAAINGLLGTLDPHSILMPPRMYREMKLSTRGNFGGLGIQIGLREGKLTVISPIADTPAWRAGIKAKDAIVKIDGTSTVNMGLDEAVSMMRGPKGTACTISVMRKGFSTPKDFTIVRDTINIESVQSKLLPGGIGYARVTSFQGNTVHDLKEHLDKMRRFGALKGLILDLRGNPGGLLESATQLSDLFLASGEIVSTVGAGNKIIDRSDASLFGTESPYPMAVLVESSSASASEIVAGALKNNDRAILLGDRTFGKGSVQVLFEMDDESALKLTVAQWLIPGGKSIQSVGVVPDIQLLPVFFDKDVIDFYSSDKMRRERNLSRHLSNAGTVEDQPFESLRYLFDEKRDTAGPDAPPNEVNTNDFAIGLALKLLQKAGPSVHERPILLQRGLESVRKVAAQEEAKIVAELAKRAVDWTLVKDENAASLETTLTTNLSKPFVAGSELLLTLTVKNTGTSTLSRLRAVSECPNLAFNRHEFFFGLLKPGTTKSWTQKVTLPKDGDLRSDDVIFRFYSEGASTAPKPFTTTLEMTNKPKPSFAYQARLLASSDKDKSAVAAPQKGQTYTLEVTVENLGPGALESGLSTLKNSDSLKDINIEAGRAEFKKLAPHEKSTLNFVFRIEDTAELGEFPMDLLILDNDMHSYLQDKLRFKMGAPFAQEKPKRAPEIELQNENALLFQSGDTITLKGTAKSERAILDLYILDNGKKVYYKSNQGAADPQQMMFETNISLTEGAHSIIIIARESEDFVGRRVVHVYRKKSSDAPTLGSQDEDSEDQGEEEP